MKTELILAVRAAGLPPSINTTGFHQMSLPVITRILDDAGLFIGPRYLLEEMPEFKQIIPYNVLLYKGKVVRYTRTSNSGEGKLHGRVSIGVGGHIDLEDVIQDPTAVSHVRIGSTLMESARREIQEEIAGLTKFYLHSWAGIVVNNEDAVGKVHIGVVGVWGLNEDPYDFTVEDALCQVGLEDHDELLSKAKGTGPDKFEAWTVAVLESNVIKDFSLIW